MNFNITEFMNTLKDNVNAWLPTVTSIISIIICVVVGMAKLKAAAKDLKSNDVFEKLLAEIEADRSENRENKRLLRRYIDENHKIMRREDEESGSNRFEDQ